MPLPSPILDDRSYQQLRDELVRRIPVYAPEWTDNNASDPGITLIELFAYLGENLLYRFNQIPETTKLQFLKLLQIPVRPAVASTGMVGFTTDSPTGVLAPEQSECRAGATSFETGTEVMVWPLSALGMARVRTAAPAPADGDSFTFTQQALTALVQKAQENNQTLDVGTLSNAAVYYKTQTLPDDPSLPTAQAIDFGATVDSTLWIPVLVPANMSAANLTTLQTSLPGQVINIGIIPDEQILSMDQVNPCAGVPPAPSTRAPTVWQISVGLDPSGQPHYRELVPVGDSTRGFGCPGVVRLELPKDATQYGNFALSDSDLVGTGELPPPIDDATVAARVIFWIRAFRTDGSSLGRLLWVGTNVSDVTQQKTANPEFLGTGNAQANQVYRLVNPNVVAGSQTIEVESADGWTPWTQVDGFQGSTESDKVYLLDAEAGTVTFGNGVQGLAPQIGQRIRATTYKYGGGSAGNVAAKAITKVLEVSGVKVSNPLPTRFGADSEAVADALTRIPAEFRRHDRAVCASDFQELALATPGAGIGRAEVLPLFYPPNASSFNPADPATFAAGVVSVVVWPAVDNKRPEAPMPDANTLQAVCSWLDARRLVTTELYVIPPTYRKVACSVGFQPQNGYGIEAVRRWVELAVRQFLAPLPPYGPTGSGWPLGRRVYGPEIEGAALQVEGVDFVFQVNLAYFDEATQTWVQSLATAEGTGCLPQAVDLKPYEVVQLTELTIVQGQPLPAGAQIPSPIAAPNPNSPVPPQPIPIPTIKEEC
jgi:hypothetical protein